jgi:triacylglycerol lipase
VNPPLQAYFGTDVAQYPARSAIPGLVATQVPLLLAYAELDPPDFETQSQQLHAALCQAARPQVLYQLMGHSHMSELFAINTADTSLSLLLGHFMAQSVA